MAPQHDTELWNEFTKSMTWGHLIQEYREALAHVEGYQLAHPEQALPTPVFLAMAGLRTAYDGLRHAVENLPCHGQPAPPDAVNLILATVRRVMIDVPTVEPQGRA